MAARRTALRNRKGPPPGPTGARSRISPGLRRKRPRSYAEWSALARWGKLPPWEPRATGYLLRSARERAGLTQEELAERLGVTQQAVAQAERPDVNPTVRFLESWAEALGLDLEMALVERNEVASGRP